ncbi:MAG TPA: S9 family peptidase [Candidatus Limnocylindrales bacterium]|nr:S9 family peptidase [Candidatus Limnocylindrales bacterium]
MPEAGQPSGARDKPTIEAIVALEPPREFRVHPTDRVVAYTDEAAGARQLFVRPFGAGSELQVTASEKDVSDPQWSPDGRRLAYVREDAIWLVEADGSRSTLVTDHPAGSSMPRWSPDGRTIAFVSRRRGWSQVWLAAAPTPRRGRPPTGEPKQPEARVLTPAGVDVEDFDWSRDGRRIAFMAQREPDLATSQISVVDVATGVDEIVAGVGAWETAGRWTPDGGLLLVSDADGWFQVVHLSADRRRRTQLTAGEVEHGEPGGEWGFRPLPSPDGRRFVHVAIHDGLVDLVVAPLDPDAGAGTAVNPWPGIWRAVGWLSDGSGLVALGESEQRPQDLWILPVAGEARRTRPPRQVTDSLPAALRPAFLGPAFVKGERFRFEARDGLAIEGTLWRPRSTGGRRSRPEARDTTRVPVVISPHGGPTWQSYRGWNPFKQLLVREGFAVADVDFRGSTGYGRAFRQANHGEWGHGDVRDLVDAARWLRDQPWANGRLAIWGGSYGGYMVLSALVEEPDLWAAGIDLYGDSEIAESYRHGDRLGRLDLERQMGRPDDPAAADLYRRGSPVYRAEAIQAPLLILHGRKDKRVVPLMTERIVEALEIEGKHHEVTWYDDEAHGWKKRETRRDAFGKVLGFLRRHVLDERHEDGRGPRT